MDIKIIHPQLKYIFTCIYFQTLINVLISIVLSGGSQNIMESLPGMHSAFRSDHSLSIVPQTFCSALVKLVAMQMQALGVSSFYFSFIKVLISE